MPKEINHESHILVKKIYGGMTERKKKKPTDDFYCFRKSIQ